MGIHPTIEAATLGMWDTMIVMIMALVVFGPRRLPKIGRQIGKLMYEFRKASNDFRFQMEEELRNAEEADRRQREEAERQRALAATAAQPPAQIEASAPPAELPAPTAGQSEEYSASENEDYHSSYDEAAYDHYQRGAPEAENGSENEPEPERLSVKPPASGAPVPAERPTSRASQDAEKPLSQEDTGDSPYVTEGRSMGPSAPEGYSSPDSPDALPFSAASSAPPAAPVEAAPAVEPEADPEIAEFPPSGDEAALCHTEELNAKIPAPRILPPNGTSAETEPAAHHG